MHVISHTAGVCLSKYNYPSLQLSLAHSFIVLLFNQETWSHSLDAQEQHGIKHTTKHKRTL